MELPFLFVHGAAVWKILLVALVAASLALVALLRWLAARGTARREVADLAAAATPLAEGDVVLTGTLVAGWVTTFIQDDRETTGRTTVLAIDHQGERIALEGDVFVTHGARTRSWWCFVPRSIPRSLRPRRFSAGLHHRIATGDRVIVSGRLGREAIADIGYRDSARRWTLSAGDHPVTIAADAPRVRSMPLGMTRWLVGSCLLGAIWFGALHVIGQRALRDRRDAAAHEIAPFGSLAIAAAMPGRASC